MLLFRNSFKDCLPVYRFSGSVSGTPPRGSIRKACASTELAAQVYTLVFRLAVFCWNEGCIDKLARNIYLNRSRAHGVSAVRVAVDQQCVQFADSVARSSRHCSCEPNTLLIMMRKKNRKRNVPECAMWFLHICTSFRPSTLRPALISKVEPRLLPFLCGV